MDGQDMQDSGRLGKLSKILLIHVEIEGFKEENYVGNGDNF